MKTDKVKTLTFKFVDDKEGYFLYINGKKVTNGVELPIGEHKKIARTLSRTALGLYAELDKVINDTEMKV